jgi:metallo-beta-lactamase class B
MNRRLILQILALAASAGQLLDGQALGRHYFPNDYEYGKKITARMAELQQSVAGRVQEPFPPFKVIGNTYYVGVTGAGAFLITSPQGHILVNSTYAETAPLVQKSVEQLGFKLTDIKIILIDHRHGDKAGGASWLQEHTGAQLMAMDGDAQIIARGGRGGYNAAPGVVTLVPPRLAARPGSGAAGTPATVAGDGGGGSEGGYYPPARVDHVLHHEEQIKLGDIVVTAHHIPGHTEGSTTYTWTALESGKTYSIVELCCVQTPAQNLSVLKAMANDPARPFPALGAGDQWAIAVMRRDYVRLENLVFDVFLTGRPFEWLMYDKYEQYKKTGDFRMFINRHDYRSDLAARELELEEAIMRGVPAGMKINP